MMGKIRLKICGLRDNIREVAGLHPDYAGFIFYPKSPRYVGEEFRMPALDKSIKKVGVFVNESVEKVIELTKRNDLDFVQLHGEERLEACAALQDHGIKVIKAFGMDQSFDFSKLEQYDSTVDFFLFDTKTSAFGGSGKSFNWNILEKYDLNKPYFLSGGISLENIQDLDKVEMKKVHALDVNSRFETRPGLKDLVRLKELMDKINN